MKSLFAAAAFAAVGLSPALVMAQAYPVTIVQFAGGPDQNAQFASAKGVVYGDDGVAAYRGDQGFVLGAVGNPSGRVYEWDMTRQQVRVSPPGKPGAWLSCADLKPMPIACATSLRIASDGALVIDKRSDRSTRGVDVSLSPSSSSRGVPDCPGDPRCPK